MHPGIKRAWLQTGGLPVEPVHQDLRAELDQVHDVEYIGGACFRLRNAAGRQVGLVQFQGEAQSRLDQAVAATTQRLAAGEEKPVDIAAGDTLIRPLDMRDPVDRTLAETAIGRADANVIIPDPERQDPPPIDLPDYVPDAADPAWMQDQEEAVSGRLLGWMFVAIVVAAIVGIVLIARETSFITWGRG